MWLSKWCHTPRIAANVMHFRIMCQSHDVAAAQRPTVNDKTAQRQHTHMPEIAVTLKPRLWMPDLHNEMVYRCDRGAVFEQQPGVKIACIFDIIPSFVLHVLQFPGARVIDTCICLYYEFRHKTQSFVLCIRLGIYLHDCMMELGKRIHCTHSLVSEYSYYLHITPLRKSLESNLWFIYLPLLEHIAEIQLQLENKTARTYINHVHVRDALSSSAAATALAINNASKRCV